MDNCVCGSREYSTKAVPYYVVTSTGKTRKAPKSSFMALKVCEECGLERRFEAEYKTPEEFIKFYEEYTPTSASYKAKLYDHDREVAIKRADEYCIHPNEMLLDVGSGSGAFIDECRNRGALAYGCEIGEYDCAKGTQYTHKGMMESLNFPTDHYDRIMCHDVLEHALDPKALVAEMFRAVKQEGVCIVEIPRFNHKTGAHHWKKEHLWFFHEKHLQALMEKVGFEVTTTYHPIESKTVLCGYKPVQERPSVLLPPGIGDTYWSLIKLRAFIEREKLSLPDLFVACNRDAKYNGHKRAFPFLETVPFAHSSGKALQTGNDPKRRKIWIEAYGQEGKTIFKDVIKCDYFIAYNGHLRVGKQMEDLDPDLNTEWHLPLFVSLEQQRFQQECRERFGRYIALYFIFQGTYRYWIDEFPINKVAAYIKQVAKVTGCTPVLVGARWDNENAIFKQVKALVPNCVDMTGKTTVDQAFGLLKGAEMVVGYPSGLTIMSAVFGLKTLVIWNDYYNREFAWNCMPPDTRRQTYFIENTQKLEPNYLADMSLKILNGEKPQERLFGPITPRPGLPKKPRVKAKAEPQSSNTRTFDAPEGARTLQAPVPAPKRRPARICPEPTPPLRTRNRARSRHRVRPVQQVIVPRRDHRSILVQVPPKPMVTDKLTIACVLRAGGSYDAGHVLKLKSMIDRNTTEPFDFVCFSDIDVEGIETTPLLQRLPSWWSKLELFRLTTGPVLYFDLDTLILNNIDKMLIGAQELKQGKFRMLVPFNKVRAARRLWASGVMAWNGDFRFMPERITRALMTQDRGDQVYICNSLSRNNTNIMPVNEWANICSFKKDCVPSGKPPMGAQIVCVHGRIDIGSLSYPWIKEVWK